MTQFERATRIQNLGVSTILQIGAQAAQMKRAGKPVIILGAGEPDFDTPDNVKQAAIAAIKAGDTKYTALDGTPALKQAICTKFSRDNDLQFTPDQITVASGAKQILFNAFMATLNPGDEVIIPTPYWTSYADIICVAGGTPVLIATEERDGFLLTPAALSAAITPRTRWVLFNSPSNPSGAMYDHAAYSALMEVLRPHENIWVLADDIYEHLVYASDGFVTPAQVAPDLADRILTMNGVSKAYAMTGWRIGYAAGPSDLVKAMAVIQSQSTSCPCSVSQAAATEALSGPQDVLGTRRDSFQRRRDLVVDGLNKVEGLSCRSPEGAFYAYVGCAGLLGRTLANGARYETDTDLCAYLIEEYYLALVPGSAFGLSPYFRVSYAASTEDLTEAIARIQSAFTTST
ncbi:pyridoxal phosphate-dependent aminotransferase [Tritonibacter mobilis]|uniref:pyridoxal phosphate-dependent aminotransferase n=1 Tax=Tritonibacter mobilis TaxID=379347 RepID=UPI000806A09F|nr:pyridoxal phosphate-dependent aminotransferase [Tritonibacter mobilis]NKX29995.1 pyridoxal phosphate-dependent aminotransferase [Rhodobacteraceae bacterium R_SAG6]